MWYDTTCAMLVYVIRHCMCYASICGTYTACALLVYVIQRYVCYVGTCVTALNVSYAGTCDTALHVLYWYMWYDTTCAMPVYVVRTLRVL